MKEIKIVISADGRINLGVSGVSGAACKELTKKLEKALGSVESTQKTSEYHESTTQLDQEQKAEN